MNPVIIFRCLADNSRLKSLLLLEQEGELCECELKAALNESLPNVSRHLAQLRECGFLADRRQEHWVFYRVAEDLPHWVKELLATTHKANLHLLEQCINNLSKMHSRPTRIQLHAEEA